VTGRAMTGLQTRYKIIIKGKIKFRKVFEILGFVIP
jgi:hypothetical protein